MSGSEKLAKWVDESSVLWIDRKSRAYAFLIAFVLAVSGLVLVEYSEPWRFLKRFHASQDTSASYQLATWKIANDITLPGDKVILIGGSASRELTAADTFVSKELRNVCGENVTFINSATPGQTLPETWSTIRALKSTSMKTLVYGFNDWKLSEGFLDIIRQARSTRLPFATPPEMTAYLSGQLDRPLVSYPVPKASGWMLANRIGFSSLGQAVEEYPDPFQSEHHRYTYPPKSLTEKQAIAARFLAESSQPMELKYLEAAEIFAALVRDLKQSGIEVVFLLLPQSSVLDRHRSYTKQMASEGLKIIQESGAKIYDWREIPALVEADFYDQTHILASGRKKVHPLLVSMLAENYQHCDGHQNTQ